MTPVELQRKLEEMNVWCEALRTGHRHTILGEISLSMRERSACERRVERLKNELLQEMRV